MREMTMAEFLTAELSPNETVIITDGPQPLLATAEHRIARQWFTAITQKREGETEH